MRIIIGVTFIRIRLARSLLFFNCRLLIRVPLQQSRGQQTDKVLESPDPQTHLIATPAFLTTLQIPETKARSRGGGKVYKCHPNISRV